MAGGNKGFAGLIAGGGEGAPEPRRPPRTGFLGARDNRLAELASGGLITRTHEAIDPAVCRIWEGHNRDYDALNINVCADLVASLRAQGKQEVPAIVRRITGDPTYRFEVICGARRHWSVTWLRANDYPDFKFVVEPREMSDEEAFRVADLENRSRKDLSDYERASDYARAVDRYYGGSQQRMVERLQVTKSWLSRYLELAKLPTEIVQCFESPHVIGITHAAALAPVLGQPSMRQRLLDEAAILGADQKTRLAEGAAAITPAQVVSRLLANRQPKIGVALRSKNIVDDFGKVVVRVHPGEKGDLIFSVSRTRLKDWDAVAEAIRRHLSAPS